MKTFLQIWGLFLLHLLVAAGVYYAAFVVPLPASRRRYILARPFSWMARDYRRGLGIAAFIVVTVPATLG